MSLSRSIPVIDSFLLRSPIKAGPPPNTLLDQRNRPPRAQSSHHQTGSWCRVGCLRPHQFIPRQSTKVLQMWTSQLIAALRITCTKCLKSYASGWSPKSTHTSITSPKKAIFELILLFTTNIYHKSLLGSLALAGASSKWKKLHSSKESEWSTGSLTIALNDLWGGTLASPFALAKPRDVKWWHNQWP